MHRSTILLEDPIATIFSHPAAPPKHHQSFGKDRFPTWHHRSLRFVSARLPPILDMIGDTRYATDDDTSGSTLAGMLWVDRKCIE